MAVQTRDGGFEVALFSGDYGARVRIAPKGQRCEAFCGTLTSSIALTPIAKPFSPSPQACLGSRGPGGEGRIEWAAEHLFGGTLCAA